MNDRQVCTNFVLLALVVLWAALLHPSISCPAKCFCNSLSRHVSCLGSALADMSRTIPSDTRFLSISATVGSQLAHLKRAHFAHLNELTDLYVTHSRVRSIDEDTFQSMPRLRRIIISNNKIEKFPKGLFQNLPHLSNIDITGNIRCQIEHGIFRNIVSLRYLYAGYVNIGSVKSDTFEGLSSLIGLHIPGNNLDEIDSDSLASLTSLKALDISDNNLRTLPRSLHPRLSKLKTLYLAENPWHCNCAMEWLKTIEAISLPASPTTPVSSDSLVTCFTPTSLRFQALNKIPGRELPCVEPRNLDCGGNYSVDEGTPLVVRCEVYGEPEPAMAFTNPVKVTMDEVNPMGDDYNVKHFTLTIPSASQKDDGEWIVSATNAKGQTETRVQVRIVRFTEQETTTRPGRNATAEPSVGGAEPTVGGSSPGLRRRTGVRRNPAESSVGNTGIILAAVASILTVVAAACLATCAIHRRYMRNRVQPFHDDENVSTPVTRWM